MEMTFRLLRVSNIEDCPSSSSSESDSKDSEEIQARTSDSDSDSKSEESVEPTKPKTAQKQPPPDILQPHGLAWTLNPNGIVEDNYKGTWYGPRLQMGLRYSNSPADFERLVCLFVFINCELYLNLSISNFRGEKVSKTLKTRKLEDTGFSPRVYISHVRNKFEYIVA